MSELQEGTASCSAERVRSENIADAIVAKISSVTRRRALEHAAEVGEIIAQGVYEGSLTAVRERGEADPLYKEIAGHRDLPFGPKRLWVCLKIYELVQSFPGLLKASHLGVAHVRAVVNLPSPVQQRLLTSAEKERWTSQRMEEEASTRRRTPINRGRPPTNAFLRTIQRIEQMATSVQRELEPRVRGRLSHEQAHTACENLRNARRWIDSIQADLERYMTTAPPEAT